MDGAPDKLRLPKGFFVKERDDVYDDWQIAFFRELFQNSVDAGASNVEVAIAAAEGKGSFGRPPAKAEVVRIAFVDDGVGMDEATLRNVYFTLGASTKTADPAGAGRTIGGFGRARLLTCFSQVRYAIRTRDVVVEGDGVEFTVAKSPDGAFVKGCAIEVDVDPAENPARAWRNPSVDTLRRKLDDYLAQSQIPCRVTVDGVRSTLNCRRGPALRKLLDAQGREFASVHVSSSPNARHRKSVVVRVAGAAMYVERTSADVQVIVEVDPARSREVLTANRDGMHEEFRNALQGFLEDLNADRRSALEDKERRKSTTLRGSMGMMVASQPAKPTRPSEAGEAPEAAERAGAAPTDAAPKGSPAPADLPRAALAKPIAELFAGCANGEIVGRWLDRIAAGENAPFPARLTQPGEVRAFETDVKGAFAGEPLKALPQELRAILFRMFAEPGKAPRLDGFHDVVIYEDDVTPGITKARWRHDPRNWDLANGRGLAPRGVLALWTVACEHAVRALMKSNPQLDEVRWTTGWLFSAAKESWRGDAFGKHRTEAMNKQVEGGGHALLLNPVDDSGRMLFKPSSREDRRALCALAKHEVAHILRERHDETYASLLTDLDKAFDERAASRDMDRALDAIKTTFGRGRAAVQRMDDEDGVRPAERLAALAAPHAFAAAAGSTAAAASVADGLATEGRVTEVDCDRLGDAESAVSEAVSSGAHGLPDKDDATRVPR